MDLPGAVLAEVTAAVPEPQPEALKVALLLLRPAGSEPPQAYAVGLAVLTVPPALADAEPVLVAIDDVQWLDDASLDGLSYAHRRAGLTPLGLLLAASEPVDLLADAPSTLTRWRDLAAAASTETVKFAPFTPARSAGCCPSRRRRPRRIRSPASRTATRSGRGIS